MEISKEGKIILDIDFDFMDTGKLPLIISSKTGVIYEAQVNGYLCEQVSLEGFVILVSNTYRVIDDCEEGLCCLCAELGDELLKRRTTIAKIIDDEFLKFSSLMRFDFDRIEELKEGWWPVKYKLRYLDEKEWSDRHKMSFKMQKKDWVEGILCTGNCD